MNKQLLRPKKEEKLINPPCDKVLGSMKHLKNVLTSLEVLKIIVILFNCRDDVPSVPAGDMDINTALQEVLKTALIHDGLARGLRECAKVRLSKILCIG